jgi:hypothetical protein
MVRLTPHPGKLDCSYGTLFTFMNEIDNFTSSVRRNKRGQLKTSYKSDYVTTNLDLDSAGGPTVRGAAVVGLVLSPQGHGHFSVVVAIFQPFNRLQLRLQIQRLAGRISDGI